MSVPEASYPGRVEAELACEMCFKSYQRRACLLPNLRFSSSSCPSPFPILILTPLQPLAASVPNSSHTGDLLVRHRRRCQGPRKSANRRKACNACVQAKVKCCYTQPTCSRCVKRGTECVYAASPAKSIPDHLERSEAVAAPNSDLQSSSSRIGNLATPSQFFELDLPAWQFPASPYSLDTFGMTLAHLANPPQVTLPGLTTTQPSIVHENPEIAPPSQMLSLSPTSRSIPPPAPIDPSSSDSVSSPATPPSSTSLALVRVLHEYPSLLMKGSFLSPFLHLSLYSLYSNVVPDMTFLPLTSMAICCGSGISMSDGNRFFQAGHGCCTAEIDWKFRACY